MKAPFPYFGGKSRAAELVWSRLGNVGNYVEPFAGSLAVLLARPHKPRIETVNDRDCYLANFWRALRADPQKVAHYADWPVNECDLQARHRWLCGRRQFRERMLKEPNYFDAKVAGWWVWGISQWIGAGWCSRPEWIGRGQGGRCPRGLNASIHAKRPHLSGNGATGVHRKLLIMTRSNQRGAQNTGILEWMLALADRLRRVRVCCGDWSRVVTPSCTWKLGGGQLTGVFLDPPYSPELRDNRLYSVEQDIAAGVRAWALEAGQNARMRIALCGLEGEHEMPGWEMARWRAPRGYSKKPPRREVIWFSPASLRQESLFNEGATA